MLTEKYSQMSIHEQREFIGSLVHACQTNERCFLAGQQIVEWAERNKLFDGVKILPEGWNDTPTEPKKTIHEQY